MQEQDQLHAQDHGVPPPENDSSDVVEAIRWVWENFTKLYVTTDEGVTVFDKEVLNKAPSTGAMSFAEYALRDGKGFFNRFVTRLLPKDMSGAGNEIEETEEDRLAMLDPSFEDMKNFFELPVVADEPEYISTPVEVETPDEVEDDEW